MVFLGRRAALLALIGAAAVLLVGLGALVGFTSADDDAARAAVVADLPPEKPRRDLPKALDGTAFDAARVGDWIVVGGDFLQVELQDGTIVNQAGVYAYNIDTGAFNHGFRPAISRNSSNPVVLAVEPAENGTHVFIGGKFASIDGHTTQRLARLSLIDGSVDTEFAAVADAPVRDLVLHDGQLFVGGEFETINGVARGRLAELDPTTGTVDPDFSFDVTGSTRNPDEPYGPKYLGVTPGGTLVVAHRATTVAGQPRKGVALIDTVNDTLLGWQTDFWGVNVVTTVDAEVSPDGSFLVVVGDGGDFPFMGRDAAVAFDLTNPDSGGQEPLWIARNFDSTYAVGITMDAVFIGGHFCWVESELAPDPWPGDGEFSNSNSCHGIFPAARFAPAVVYRDQIAALDPATGKALAWDPGSDALEGVQSIEVIDRGLLIGHDGDRFGRDGSDSRAWNVGRHVFLDWLEPYEVNTSLFIDAPVMGTCDGLEPTITGTTRSDVIEGTEGPDVILAGPGSDTIRGLGGDDVICGGDGNDRIYGDDGDDTVFAGEGGDRLYGGAGHDELRGEGGRDIILGEQGNDTLVGGRGKDRIAGRSGDDVLKGSVGADKLKGGPHADRIIGGGGSDLCEGNDEGVPDDDGDTYKSCP